MISREFVPGVSCDHVAHAGPKWTICPRCGSRCERDRDGKIVGYSRGTWDAPKPETRERAAD